MIELRQLNLEFKLNQGAPTPHLFCDEGSIYLFFYSRKLDLEKISFPMPRNINSDSGVIKVTFKSYELYKFGSPNDEVLSGHRYYKLGLKHYSISEVINSDWIEELKKINSVHRNYNPDGFQRLRHYIFCFHETTFECISTGFDYDFLDKPMTEAIVEFINIWRT